MYWGRFWLACHVPAWKEVYLTFWIVVHTLISQLKPKFNNAETKKPFHEFSFKHSSNFFLCVGYFSRKNIVFVFSTFIKFSCEKWIHGGFFSTCSRYCWNYCHFIFSRSCFRPEVSFSIIVKCNVNREAKWQGSEMEDHVQPIGLVFIIMREWFTVI